MLSEVAILEFTDCKLLVKEKIVFGRKMGGCFIGMSKGILDIAVNANQDWDIFLQILSKPFLDKSEAENSDSPSGIGFAFHGVKIDRIYWMGSPFPQ